MCDIKYTKICRLLLLSLVLLFAVLPAKLEARPRVTTNSKTNSVDDLTTFQEISVQEDHQVVTSTITPLESEEIVITTAVDIGNKDLLIESENVEPQILIPPINLTNSPEAKTQGENPKDKINNEEDVKATDFQNDEIQTTTFLPIDVTSSDKIDIPIEFPSEKNNLFTILNAKDFPILSRKLRGENLGYFENPIESTDSTYSHVPIEFPTQDSDIKILNSKDHPAFLNFLTNRNEGRGLSLDLEESSGNFDKEIIENEMKSSITTENVSDFQEINFVSTTELALITEIAPRAASESFKEFIEYNSENQQEPNIENKPSIFTDELILPTNESNSPVEFSNGYNNDATVTQSEDTLIFEDLYSQKHSTGTSTNELSKDTTELVEIKLDNFFSTPFPEIQSKTLLPTISTNPPQNVLETENALVISNIKDDIRSLVGQNDEDYWDRKENFLNEDKIARTEEPINLSKGSVKITEISEIDSPRLSTDKVRNERMFDNAEALEKGNTSEVLTSEINIKHSEENLVSLNSEKLTEEESSTVEKDLNFMLPTEFTTAVSTILPELESVYTSTQKNSLNILKLEEYPDSITILSEESTNNFLEGRSFKNNITSSVEEENGQFFEHTISPSGKDTDITTRNSENFQTTTKMDGLIENTTSEKYLENSNTENIENTSSLNFESTTSPVLDDKQSDIITVENTPAMIELKLNKISEHDDKITTTSKIGLLSEEEGPEKPTEDFNSEDEIPLLRISVVPAIHPAEDVVSIVDSKFEELEVKHSLKNSEEESINREEVIESRNDFEGYLQSISENSKSENNESINEEQVKVVTDEDGQNGLIPTILLNEEKIETSSESGIENYGITQTSEDTTVPNFSIFQHSDTVKIGFKFNEVSDIITEEETSEKLQKENDSEHSKNNNKHNSSLVSKPLSEDLTPREKIENFETNDNFNEVLEPEIQPQKKPKVFPVSKKFQSSEETSSSEEEHLNRKKTVRLNTSIENKSSSESVESHEISYFPSQKRFPYKTVYQGRAFSDDSGDFRDELQPFQEIGAEETAEFDSVDHSVIKKPAALDSTLSPLIFTEKIIASSTEIEETRSSANDAISTTLPSFTEIIVEAAELTTELNHEIESFRTTDQTTEGVFEETFAAIGSTISTEVDKHNLGDALPTHDMKKAVVASDISLSVILMISMIGIVVVLALLVTTWYKIRNSGNTFDIQLEEQRHRKEQGSQTISVSE